VQVLQPIIVVPFASEVHRKEYYVAILDILKHYISRHGVEIHNGIVTTVEEADQIGRKYHEFLPVVLALTGGTSKLIESFISSGDYERLLIFSHAEHNSLASAISSRNKAERRGVVSLVYHCSDINSISCTSTIDRMLRVSKAIASVIGLKVGTIVDRDVKEELEENFETRFKAKIVIKSTNELLSEIGSLNEGKVTEAKGLIAKLLNLDPSIQQLDSIARLYLALKKFEHEEKLSAITIDCFPFILKYGATPCIPLAVLNTEGVVAGCEADLPSLLGLMLAKAITGRSGWIANVVDVVSNVCYLAHCTMALDIAKNIKIVPHFETGKPYALTGEYLGDAVTLLSIDRDFTLATIAVGRVISSGNLDLATCRTQMMVEFDYPVELLPNIASGNHHIVMFGDRRKELTESLYMLGFDVVDYRELVV